MRLNAIPALVSVLVLAGCTSSTGSPGAADGDGSSWRHVEVDHRTNPDTPGDVASVGPEPGVLTEDWRIEDFEGDDPDFWLDAGALVAVSERGAEAFDAGSGESLWWYHEPGRSAAGAVTEGVVVLATWGPARTGDDDADRLLGLDAGTGELLWEQPREGAVGIFGNRLAVGDGIVPILRDDRPDSAGVIPKETEVVGLDAGTGEVEWTTEHDRCGGGLEPPRTSDGSVVLIRDRGIVPSEDSELRERCQDTRVRGFDPADGGLLWTNRWDGFVPPIDASVSVHDGVTVIEDIEGGEQVIDRDGAVRVGAGAVRGRVGEYLLARDREARAVTLLDARTGAVVSDAWPGLHRGTHAVLDDEGVLYALAQSELLDGGLDLVMGEVSGAAEPTLMPTPDAALAAGYVVWAGVADGRILFAHTDDDDDRPTVFAYSSEPTDGPVELGGVPLEAWPDPCDLGVADVEGVPSGEPERRSPDPGNDAEPIGGSCRYAVAYGEDGFGDRVDIGIDWVAPRPEFAEGRVGRDAVPGPAGIDEMYEREIVRGSTIDARVGSVLLSVYINIDDVETDAVLEAIAEHLADYRPGDS